MRFLTADAARAPSCERPTPPPRPRSRSEPATGPGWPPSRRGSPPSCTGWTSLAADIADHDGNQTRFVVVARDGVPAPTGHDKTSVVIYQRANEPGSLISILQEFAARRINLSKLESRPTKAGGLGDYCFVIDADGHIGDELMADALRALHAKQGGVKFLGSYPAARRPRLHRPRARRRPLAPGRRLDGRPPHAHPLTGSCPPSDGAAGPPAPVSPSAAPCPAIGDTGTGIEPRPLPSDAGTVAERTIAPALKAGGRKARGFESLPFRGEMSQDIPDCPNPHLGSCCCGLRAADPARRGRGQAAATLAVRGRQAPRHQLSTCHAAGPVTPRHAVQVRHRSLSPRPRPGDRPASIPETRPSTAGPGSPWP